MGTLAISLLATEGTVAEDAPFSPLLLGAGAFLLLVALLMITLQFDKHN